MNLKKLSDRLSEQKRQTDSLIRKILIDILRKVPDNTVSFVDKPAYALVECTDYWMETPVYGIRLLDGCLQFTMETYHDENGKPVPWFDEDYTRSEHDHHSSLDWLSVLSSLEEYTDDNAAAATATAAYEIPADILEKKTSFTRKKHKASIL